MIPIGYTLMCLVFGTTFYAIKIGLNEGMPPLFMAAIRFSSASVLILLYMAFKKRSLVKGWRQWIEIGFQGILMTTIPFAALFWAEQYITSGIASLLVATAPVFVGILSKMSKLQWAGLFLTFSGIACIVYPDLLQMESGWNGHAAKLLIVLSELSFAFGVIRSKKLLETGISPFTYNGLQMGIASLVLFLLSMGFEAPYRFQWNYTMTVSFLYLSIVASIIASGIYYWLVKVTNPLFPSTWTMISPIIALIAGYLFLGETMRLIGWIGLIGTLLGLLLINRDLWLRLKRRILN